MLVSLALVAPARADDAAGQEYFEKRIRSVLTAHGYKCHSGQAKKLKGGLRLDQSADWLKGGLSGPAVVPGKAGESLLIKAVRHQDEETLIRRVTFDLTALPPTPKKVEAFVQEGSPGAFAKGIDRLLASPHYGERWGRHWLDVVRYADTAGEGLPVAGVNANDKPIKYLTIAQPARSFLVHPCNTPGGTTALPMSAAMWCAECWREAWRFSGAMASPRQADSLLSNVALHPCTRHSIRAASRRASSISTLCVPACFPAGGCRCT
jgi:hypothetical protein